MRIATMMSIAVLGLSGAAIAQVTATPDQDTPAAMQNDMANNMAAPDTMGNDVMTDDLAKPIDTMADDMNATIAPTMPDAVPPTAVPDTTDTTMPPLTPLPDGTATTPDDTGERP